MEILTKLERNLRETALESDQGLKRNVRVPPFGIYQTSNGSPQGNLKDIEEHLRDPFRNLYEFEEKYKGTSFRH